MAGICSCINNECKISQWCKRTTIYKDGEPIDFRNICNMENKYDHIILTTETTIEKSEDK